MVTIFLGLGPYKKCPGRIYLSLLLEASFPAIFASSSKQSLLSTSALYSLRLFISFNTLSWFTFMSACVNCSKFVSSGIILLVNKFSINKLLFKFFAISYLSGIKLCQDLVGSDMFLIHHSRFYATYCQLPFYPKYVEGVHKWWLNFVFWCFKISFLLFRF